MQQFVGPLIIVIFYLALAIGWNRRVIAFLRQHGVTVPAENLTLSTGIRTHYLNYSYSVASKPYQRRQRISKRDFDALRVEQVPVTVTYNPKKPDMARLFDYLTPFEARETLIWMALLGVGLLIGIVQLLQQ